jgi:flagellar biosynthesis/type III secretory pathway protein FliH
MVSDIKIESEIASEEAKNIIQKAREEVEKLLKKTDEEISLKVQEAKAIGTKKGYEKSQELKEKLAKLETLILSEVKDGVVQAAFGVAENILNASVDTFPSAVLSIAQTALSELPDVTHIWLRVNPLDMPIFVQNKQKIIEGLERVKDIDIREDKQVGRGGVLIQTESGVIDAQIKTQIEEMARLLGV